MRSRLYLRSILTAATFLLAAFSSQAQVARSSFDRPRTYDVQHYVLRVKPDGASRSVTGDTTVTLKPLSDGLRSIELDAVGLVFKSVTDDAGDKKLQYRVARDKIIIALDRPYSASETVSIRFKYTAKPVKGIYFRSGEKGHSAQIFTQGEAEEARHWFPSFDFPSDKATSEEFITAKDKETVIGNGELIGKVPNNDGTTTWHYRTDFQHPTYLISFIIGEYVRIDDKYRSTPLGFYVYPGREETARKAFGDTGKIMSVFEDLTGQRFPFNKYDQTVVAKFQLGGMENITATTLQDEYVFMADLDFGNGIVVDLVSHELSHSWFGNLVTCKNWVELWLNEGFATYMEAAYREQAFGRESYISKVRLDAGTYLVDEAINRRQHGLYNRLAGNVDLLFKNPSITYNKGGAVIHMLREQVGTEAFWKGVRIYLDRHKFASVETTDLKKAMEESSGQDLTWFFDQWVYGVGSPKLSITPTYSARKKVLTLTLAQVQKINPLNPRPFRMPMNIAVTSGEETRSVAVDLKNRTETISIPMASKPTEIVIDPEDKVIVKNVKMLSIKVIP